MRQNRLVGVPLPTKKDAAKEMSRGAMKCSYTEDICTTVWMDSQAVFMMSNFTGPDPTGKSTFLFNFFSHFFAAKNKTYRYITTFKLLFRYVLQVFFCCEEVY